MNEPIEGNYLHRDALSRPHPQNVRFDRSTPEDQARLFAVLRFRLLLALVLQGEAEQAAIVVQEAQDGALATLTQTFWDAYQHTSDVQAGCTAARAAAEELEDVYIRGYQRVYTLPGIRARLCQDTDPLPDSPSPHPCSSAPGAKLSDVPRAAMLYYQ